MANTSKKSIGRMMLKVLDDNGNVLGNIEANPKKFSSGSTGFYANGKVTLDDGSKYQLGCQITLIGSKPKS